ncbi:hypothetical protein CUR178_04501 [Leishmania enriettii]|uniref:Haloacid dehalogenase-like hydrolase-like protein n=1 Tax=Leishmania enriettii TaxID=5663 RepID=A0A836GHC2_LEIEN|nr:hypothetical protein CUR178_04501 [Leishmania enriettii]
MRIRGVHADLLCVKKYVDRALSHRLSCSFALAHILDCFAKGINRGVALEMVCHYLGIVHGETIAFGDGMHDIEILQAAGQGVVISNAGEMLTQAQLSSLLSGRATRKVWR